MQITKVRKLAVSLFCVCNFSPLFIASVLIFAMILTAEADICFWSSKILPFDDLCHIKSINYIISSVSTANTFSTANIGTETIES